MITAATTTVTIDQPTAGVDAFGDPIDTYTTSTSGVVAAIYERDHTDHDPASGKLTTTTRVQLTVPYDTAIDEGWRVTDDATGDVYVVDRARRQRGGFAGHVDRTVDVQAYT